MEKEQDSDVIITEEEVIKRYLTFVVDKEIYAIPVNKVEVVLGTPVVTRVPNVDDYMRGVINYRGSVIPVIDPRLRFGGEPIALTESPSVIVLQFFYNGEEVVAGMLANGVREVIDIPSCEIEKAPTMGSRLGKGFLSGVAKVGENFVVILDVDTAFSPIKDGI